MVWLDPGLTTGVAWVNLVTWEFGSDEYDLAGTEGKLRSLAEKYPGVKTAVGYEMYLAVGGPRAGTAKYSQDVIAMTVRMTKELGFQFLKPAPSSMRLVATPVLLRRMGWYSTGNGHANDAARHALAFLMRSRPMPDMVRLKLFPGYVPSVTLAP